MSLFTFFFPADAARLARAERFARRAAALSGYDEWHDPLMTDVIAEIKAGRDIKAVQIYCQVTGSSIAEGRLAVDELKVRAAGE
jgi:hypothetical protein